MERNNIRFYRENAGMTREAVAEKSGCTLTQIFDFENGYESPTLSETEAIANVFGVTVADLTRDERAG